MSAGQEPAAGVARSEPQATPDRLARGIRIRRLRLSGLARNYEVDFRADGVVRGLSIIAGATNTGKSSVFEFINFVLGGSRYPDHEEIVRQVRGAFLETNVPEGWETLERRLEANNVLIFDTELERIGGTVPEARPVEPTGEPGSLSQHLLATVGLQGVQLKEAPTQSASDTDPLSMRDLMWVCYLPNDRLGSSQLLFEGNVAKSRKLRQVVDAVFDVHDTAQADLARRVQEATEQLGQARREYAALVAFVQQQDATSRDDLNRFVEEADADLRRVEETLTALDRDEASASSVAADLRARYGLAVRARIRAQQRVRDRESLVSRFASLRAQYADDIHKLTFLKETATVFDRLSVEYCPACLARLSSAPTLLDGICSLCHEPLDESVEHLTLGEAAVAREKPIGAAALADIDPDEQSPDAADGAARVIASELTATRRRLNELNDYWRSLDDSLPELQQQLRTALETEQELAEAIDRATGERVTPFVAARDELQRQRQAALVTRDRARRTLRLWFGVDARQERITRLAEDLQGLRRQQRDARVRPDRDEVVRSLSARFREILTDFDYPKHGETGQLDSTLLPNVRLRPYESASSGGQVLLSLAWILSIFEVAYETGARHPGFLMIDTPQKNLGGDAAPEDSEFADVRLVERFYQHVLRWLQGPGAGAQIIIVDNTPPALVEPHVVVRYTRNPAHPPYGLIDNETG